MKANLRILLLEDDVADAELIAHELEEDGFVFSLTRVETEEEFRCELEDDLPDLVLSDNRLPRLDGFKALAITRTVCPQLPFIFVCGSNDQEMVFEMYEEGATDYVFMRDIGDLKSAVVGALEKLPETMPPANPEKPGNPAQSELKLSPALGLPALPFVMPDIARLSFCPQCLRVWDEAGRMIEMEAYCANHSEIMVIRQVCAECKSPAWWS